VRAGVQDIRAIRLAANPAAAFGVLILLSLLLGLTMMRTPPPESDALRYIDYAINIHDHGVFSARREARPEAPAPENVHAPLYPAWIALFIRLNPGIRNALACARDQNGMAAACPLDFKLLVAAQLVLAGVFSGAVWLLALRLSGSASIAWTAAGFGLLAKLPLQYAHSVLTEAILLPLLALFLVSLVIAYQERRARWMLAAGVLIGLVALTRPAYAWLFFAIGGVLAAGALVTRRRPLFVAALAFALAYGVTVAPWLARNKLHFDRIALTESYAGDILSQRVAYNRMGWDEFAVAWIFWFPDFGDHIAKNLFPRRTFEKLKWNDGTYYATVAPALYAQAVAATKDPEAVLPYLLRTEVLANPVKHALVTLALAWRAVFVSKYWGIAGLVCFCVVFVRSLRTREYALLVASLPVWFMVMFHAFVSVSIPRYNLALIPLYAYALAVCAQAAAVRVAARWKARSGNRPAAR
jgi:4-amino-4-deoxy-L-arabinose transferase-like glycosyltransferase